MRKLLIVETKLWLREWPMVLFTITLPVGLLVVLGISIPALTEPDASGLRAVDTHMPSTMTLLALLTLACTMVPGVLTTYRELGVLRRMSTTPVHPARLLGVQLLINLATGVLSTIVLIVAANLVFGSPLPRQWGWFVVVFLLGTAALMAIGLVIAAVANRKAAPGIGSLAMFPLMFLGGMWVPREVMPDGLRVVSDYSIAGPFTQALKDTWAGQSPEVMHLVVMAAGLAIFGGLAVRLFRWE
ncbi:ABC transporter permease [Nonomuraea sp. K274]|uniref:ABC transporter permease n=1 Tax=Nonomuraea cypriaca TaxID=1187855 RepID=A0A931A8B8_9ACTN|nr:ABC transporter permease [Nonomuraea cypriaca]MBF8188247.1 ABC transporter permease [Nonomuraea cypriaca]